MNAKKLCSLGILDIDINLTLTQSEADKYNFNIDNYNEVSDLKNLFYPEEDSNENNTNSNVNNEIDYFNHIYLSSENNLINTLLYINRAYKLKTFIEFIMTNKLDHVDDIFNDGKMMLTLNIHEDKNKIEEKNDKVDLKENINLLENKIKKKQKIK